MCCASSSIELCHDFTLKTSFMIYHCYSALQKSTLKISLAISTLERQLLKTWSKERYQWDFLPVIGGDIDPPSGELLVPLLPTGSRGRRAPSEEVLYLCHCVKLRSSSRIKGQS